jgi:hypothetical protein
MSIPVRLTSAVHVALPEFEPAGQAILPEVDDEVLVAFAHGDARAPYALGFLWNAKDAPPPESR